MTRSGGTPLGGWRAKPARFGSTALLGLVLAAGVASGERTSQAQSRRSAVLILSTDDSPGGPSAERVAEVLGMSGYVRPLLRGESGILLAGDGRLPEGAVDRARAALSRGRDFLRVLQFASAEAEFAEAVREVRSDGMPEAHAVRREAEIARAVSMLESGRRDAALRAFVPVLTREPRFEMDPVRNSPFVREAFEQARRTVQLLPTGELRVRTQPTGLNVWVDGRIAGRSPVSLEGLVSGEHVLAVVSSERTWSRIVSVPAGSTAFFTVLPNSSADGSPVRIALEVARAMDADRVVVLARGAGERVRGRVVDVTTGRLIVVREASDEETLADILGEELRLRDERGTNVPDAPLPPDGPAPWYEEWWVYAVGVGLIGGVITAAAIMAESQGPEPVPLPE